MYTCGTVILAVKYISGSRNYKSTILLLIICLTDNLYSCSSRKQERWK